VTGARARHGDGQWGVSGWTGFNHRPLSGLGRDGPGRLLVLAGCWRCRLSGFPVARALWRGAVLLASVVGSVVCLLFKQRVLLACPVWVRTVLGVTTNRWWLTKETDTMAPRKTETILYGNTHADLVANIAAILELATADDFQDGVTWYRRARRTGGVLGRLAGYRGRRAHVVGAGVLAALSPSCEWDNNVACAFSVLDNGGRVTGTPSALQSQLFVDRALAILAGVLPLDVLGGEKVRNFYACIIDPTNPTAVCVDRHAAAVAYGYTLTDKQMQNVVAVNKSGSRYDAIADAYRAVAAARGLLPLEVQAITWVTWRRLKGNVRTFTTADAQAVAA